MTHSLLPAGAIVLIATLCGCASGAKTERVRGDDFTFVANEAAAKLGASSFLSERSAQSPRAAVTTRRAEVIARNLQLTEAERWFLVDRVGASLPAGALRERNMAFVIPEESARAMAARDPLNAFPPDRRPTHVLSMTIRSANRSGGESHSALYLFEYKITALPSGEQVWSDIVEYKREAVGRTFD